MLGLVARMIRWWMGGYRETLPLLPVSEEAAEPLRRVAVVGGGLAGMVAATTLAERGVEVVLFEASPHLGGRAGCAKVELQGEEWLLDHGFHAFFYQYYNLWRFVEKVGAREGLVPIEDYLIIDRNKEEYRFKDVATTPLLNVLSLVRRGLPPLSDAMGNPKLSELRWMLRYHEARVHQRFDGLSFADFCARLEMPAKLELVLTTLGRSFFTHPEKLSTAALLKSFHFYFLSHDRGLLYDYVDGDYQQVLIDPVLRYWRDLPIEVRCSTPVERLEREPGSSGDFLVNGERFDAAVLSVDGPAASRILQASDLAPGLTQQLSRLPVASGAAVYRLWMDRPVEGDWPVYFSVERHEVTDAISFPCRITPQAKAWAARTGGCVVELHSYAVPPELDREAMREAMLKELRYYLPQLEDAEILMEHLDLNRKVSALHTDLYEHRPGVQTELENLTLAGDWVRLPTPALLMEAACTSGLLAANSLLSARGMEQEEVLSVPRRGLLTWRPGRKNRSLSSLLTPWER